MLMNGAKIFIKSKLYRDFLNDQIKYTDNGLKHFEAYFENQFDYESKQDHLFEESRHVMYDSSNYATFRQKKDSKDDSDEYTF